MPSQVAEDCLSLPIKQKPLKQKREQIVHELCNSNLTSSVTNDIDAIVGNPVNDFPQKPLKQHREQVRCNLDKHNSNLSITDDIEYLTGNDIFFDESKRPLKQKREQIVRELKASTPSIIHEIDHIVGDNLLNDIEVQHPLRQKREQVVRELCPTNVTPSVVDSIDMIVGDLSTKKTTNQKNNKQQNNSDLSLRYKLSNTCDKNNFFENNKFSNNNYKKDDIYEEKPIVCIFLHYLII